jgi:hypothetical protein
MDVAVGVAVDVELGVELDVELDVELNVGAVEFWVVTRIPPVRISWLRLTQGPRYGG